MGLFTWKSDEKRKSYIDDEGYNIKVGDKFMIAPYVYSVAEIKDDCIVATCYICGKLHARKFLPHFTGDVIRAVSKYKKHIEKHRKLVFGCQVKGEQE